MEKNLNDAFIHNLHIIYFIEHSLVKTLEKLSMRVDSDEIREELENHRVETLNHIQNLEEVFDLAGVMREEMETDVLATLDDELEDMLDVVSPDAKDFFILQAVAQIERIEISYYEAIILAVKDLDIDNKREILGLLRENLAQEESALSVAISGMKSQVSVWRRAIH